MMLNNPLNWILSWNEWMNHILNRYLPFLMKSPLFCLFWTLFGQFSGTFPIRPVSKSPWLLNWIIFWIESAELFLNWIMFWIESWVEQYWIEYWMNHLNWIRLGIGHHYGQHCWLETTLLCIFAFETENWQAKWVIV